MPLTKVIQHSLFALIILFCNAYSAAKPALQADLDKLQDQIRLMDKDLAVLKETSSLKLDSQDKRLADIGLTTAQHANHLAAVANQTTTVGNYIGYTSIAITFLVFVAGSLAYFSAKSKAESEARDAAEKWFNQRSIQLNADIEQLRTKGFRNYKNTVLGRMVMSHQFSSAERSSRSSRSFFSLLHSLTPFS